MNLLNILGVKETNNLSVAEAYLRNVPAMLFFDDDTTKALNKTVYEYFPYDLVRIGQGARFNDFAKYTNSNEGLQLVLDFDYDAGILKCRISEFRDDLASSHAIFNPIDFDEDINDKFHTIIDATKKAIVLLGLNLTGKLETKI